MEQDKIENSVDNGDLVKVEEGDSLEQLVNKAYAIKQEQQALDAEFEKLRASIMKKMDEQKVNKFTTPSNISAIITEKKTYEYTDKPSIITWCEQNNCAEFIERSISTTKLNSELKKNTSLHESLSSFFRINEVRALTIK